MKVKLKLDANSIQQAIVDHAEKALFGLVVLGFLFFASRAITREKPIKFDAEELTNRAKAADKHLQDTDAKAPQFVDYEEVAKKISDPVGNLASGNDPFKHTNPWESPIIPIPRLRTQPAIFALRDLRGTAGSGAVGVAQGAAARGEIGASTKGFRWIVLTGLFDWRTQVEAYKTVFAETMPMEKQFDLPEYAYYRVERAEVDPQNDVLPPESSWQRINVREMAFKLSETGGAFVDRGNQTDPVDQRHMGDIAKAPTCAVNLVFPLPPVVNSTWGSEISNPQIPWRDSSQAGPYRGEGPGARGRDGMKGPPPGGAPGGDEKAPAGETGKEGPKPPAPKAAPARPMADEPDEPDTVSAPPGGRPTAPRGGPGTVVDPYAKGLGPVGPRPRGPGRKMIPGQSADSLISEEEPQHLLFRFFDYSVEPGKYYRYRVKLLLTNPNRNIPVQYLAQETLKLDTYLQSEWSVPSSPVRVPLDSRVLVAPAKSREPAGTVGLLVVHFDAGNGMEAFHECSASRGQWLTYLKQPYRLPAGIPTGGAGVGYGRNDPTGLAAGGPATVDFETEAILADYCGGGQLPGRDRDFLEPRIILLGDRAGNLIMRNELDDESDYEKFFPSTRTPAPKMRGGEAESGKVDPYAKGKPPAGGGAKKKAAPGGDIEMHTVPKGKGGRGG